MSIEDMTIGDAMKIAAMFGASAKTQEPDPMIGQRVVVRSSSMGVYGGTLERYDEAAKACTLTGARMAHGWSGAFTTLGLATYGPQDGNNSRITCEVERINLLDVGAVILMTDAADKAWSEISEHKP